MNNFNTTHTNKSSTRYKLSCKEAEGEINLRVFQN